MSVSPQELPLDVKREIEAPLLPFEELEPYDQDQGLYELDRRPEKGYDVVLLYKNIGGETLLLTRVERNGKSVEDLATPSEHPRERLEHPFPSVDPEKTELLFGRKAQP